MSAGDAAFDAGALTEGARIMTICNACRYCEGYCAVFPAMERRLTFGRADLEFLANLCHDCGDCLPACQYAPPHEFAVDVPRVLKEIRGSTYRRYAWPRAAGVAFLGSGPFAVRASALGVLAFALGAFVFGSISKAAMIAVFLAAAAYVGAVLAAGIANAWRSTGGGTLGWNDMPALAAALYDALRLKNLEGGGEGCAPNARRYFHHLAFYGFTACFAATVVAAIYDNLLGWPPPYPLLSAPVVLGTVGGITLIAGCAGLLKSATDSAFIVMLLLVAGTGLLLLGLRNMPVMPALLALHLGVVLGLFVTMPYGKFVHGFYRATALARDALEKKQVVR